MPILVPCSMEATAIIDEIADLTHSGNTDPVPWWSFTKTALATAVLRLVESGLLDLDGPVGGERFNLRQLLRHEAGLPDYGSVPKYHGDVAAGKVPWPTERLLAAVDADRLRYESGTGWAYSNIGYLKVAQLIERTSGLTLSVALERLVFEPSKLTTARLATAPADVANVQMGAARHYHPAWVYHGLVVGTVADAARLLRAPMTGGLLKPDTLGAMLEGRSLPEHRSVTHPDPAYGLGLMLWRTIRSTIRVVTAAKAPAARLQFSPRAGGWHQSGRLYRRAWTPRRIPSACYPDRTAAFRVCCSIADWQVSTNPGHPRLGFHPSFGLSLSSRR
jgi:CubicO group peptidase (beta-lactamase class C family)